MNGYISVIKHHLPLVEAIFFSILLGLASNYIFHKILKKYYHPYKKTPFSIILTAIRTLAYIIFPLIYFRIFAFLFDLSKTIYITEIFLRICITIFLSLSAMNLLDYIDLWLEHKKNLQENSANLGLFITRAYLLKKILKIIIIALTVALILLNFPVVKELGKGILISAGVAGGILVFAAQKVFTNIFSGIEVILNKPLQIGDTIVISNEMGKIEKITLNQVQLRTWDLRLIVYPLSYFIENSFQNLSHAEQGLRGTVFFYTEYKVRTEKLRQALTSILQDSPLWDKKSNTLQVTELTENNVQLRIVISAKNNDDLWNLRCYVREKMLEFIQNYCPEITPKKLIRLDSLNIKENKTANKSLNVSA